MTVRYHAKPLDELPPFRARVIRFLGAGVVNTAFGYAVFAGLVFLGAYPQIALVAQFILGVLWNYRIHGRYVFAVQGYDRLPYYAASYVLIYFFNAFLLKSLMAMGFDPYLSQALALGPVVLLSYVLISRALGIRIRGGGDASR